jgi:predicted metal-dependent peptidase
MSNFKAKILFENMNPNMVRSKMFISSMMVLQKHFRVAYTLAMNTVIIWTDKIPTAATDGFYIYINESFFRGLANDSQRAFLIGHEVLHIILKHPQRGKAYMDRGYFRCVGNKRIPLNPNWYNIDADAVINADLIAHGLEFIPSGILRDDVDRNMFVDEVYAQRFNDNDDDGDDDDKGNGDKPDHTNDIPSDDDQDGDDQDGDDQDGDGSDGDNQDGDGSDDESSDTDSTDGTGGNGGSSSQEVDENDPLGGSTHDGHDVHLVPQYDGTEEEIAKAERDDLERIEQTVDKAIDDLEKSRENGEHNQPTVSDNVSSASRRSKAVNASDIDWAAELADEATKVSGGEESTWSRIHRRRFINTGVISPSKRGTFDNITVTIDVSYSVLRHNTVVDEFVNELASLMDTLQPKSGATIIFCGDRVESVAEVSNGAELLDLDIKEGLGTYMASSLEWQEENGHQADIHLIFTDGLMSYDDITLCGDSGALFVLVDEPNYHFRSECEARQYRYIVARNDRLAA